MYVTGILMCITYIYLQSTLDISYTVPICILRYRDITVGVVVTV